MAEVRFFGIGASGFPDPDKELLDGTRRSTAEVQFEGILPAPSGTTANTVVNLLAPSMIPRSEFTTVEFTGTGPSRLPPLSVNPNFNDIGFYVVSACSGCTAIGVKAIGSDGQGVDTDLRIFSRPEVPSGLVGKTLIFGEATGALGGTGARTPYTGQRFLIVQVFSQNYIPGVQDNISRFFIASPMPGAMVGASPFPVVPQTQKLFIVEQDDVDRMLRRTPVIEVILE